MGQLWFDSIGQQALPCHATAQVLQAALQIDAQVLSACDPHAHAMQM